MGADEKTCREPQSQNPHFSQKTREMGHPGFFSMVNPLQIFLGAGVSVRHGEGGAEFFRGGFAVALLFQQLA